MKITRVTVTLNPKVTSDTNNKNSRIMAFAEVVIDSCLVISNLRVINGKQRLFVAMPSVDCGTGEIKDGKAKVLWHDIVFPTNRVTREYFEDVILGEYHRVKELVEESAENADHGNEPDSYSDNSVTDTGNDINEVTDTDKPAEE